MLGQRPALKRAAAAATAPQAAGTPVAATSGRCKIVYSSNDILHVHSQPDANSFALGHLWPSGTGATIACLDDIPQNVDGAQYNLCGGVDNIYNVVDFWGQTGFVPSRCSFFAF